MSNLSLLIYYCYTFLYHCRELLKAAIYSTKYLFVPGSVWAILRS